MAAIAQDAVAERPRETDSSRRQFLRTLGMGAAAGVGFPGAVRALETPTVKLDDHFFDPIGLSVEPGTTVGFEIKAGSHSATAYADRIPPEAAPFDSGVISRGRFEHTFDRPGTYDYYCVPHRTMGMVGRIVVGEPGGPAEAGPIPDGAVPASETIVERGMVRVDEFAGSGGDAGGGMTGAGSGMMGQGSGMMGGRGPGWMVLVPVGFLTVLLGSVGAVAYWAASRGRSGARDGPAMAAHQDVHARGDIDEEEYAERRRRLQQEGRRGG